MASKNTNSYIHDGTPFLRIIALLAFAVAIAIVSSLSTYWFLTSSSEDGQYVSQSDSAYTQDYQLPQK